jgi:hypothetical protein
VQGAWRDLLASRKSSGESAFILASFAAAALPDHAIALNWLEQSFQDHEPDLASLAIDPIFDRVRQEPRAKAILRAINLSN